MSDKLRVRASTRFGGYSRGDEVLLVDNTANRALVKNGYFELLAAEKAPTPPARRIPAERRTSASEGKTGGTPVGEKQKAAKKKASKPKAAPIVEHATNPDSEAPKSESEGDA